MQTRPPPVPPPGPVVRSPEPAKPRTPQAPPPPPLGGSLYIRGNGSLNRTNARTLLLTTMCPTSLEWLIYLNAVIKMHYGKFEFQTHFISDDEAPRFVTNRGVTYNSLNQLNESGQPLSLEPRVPADQRVIGLEMQTRKNDLMGALTNVKNAFLFGYRLFCRPDTNWVTTHLNHIRALLAPRNDATIEDYLVQKMSEACQQLSTYLGKDLYFLDALRKTLNTETEVTTIFSLSIVDIQLAASGILIRRCFEIEEVSPYATKIRAILYKYISLWAHNEIIYSSFIDEQPPPRDYTLLLQDNPELLSTTISEAGAHASGGQGDVYKVSLSADNAWNLDQNDYAFKVSKGDSTASSIAHNVMKEVDALRNQPYDNVMKVLGKGFGKLHNREVFFFVMDWIPGGSLYDRMEGLTLIQIEKVLKGVAYALHLVYTGTRDCVVDLKPQNILLDENDNPILCDFGSCAYEGYNLGEIGGTPLYNDSSKIARHSRDMFAYGVIVFMLLTGEVDESSRPNGLDVASKIHKYVAKGMDLGKLIKPHLQDEADVVTKLLHIGVECIKAALLRPSALEVLQKFEDIW